MVTILQLLVGFANDSNRVIDIAMWYMTLSFFWYLIFGCIIFINSLNDKIKMVILFGVSALMHIWWSVQYPVLSQVVRQASFGFPCGVLFAYLTMNCGKYSKIVNHWIVQLFSTIISLWIFNILYFKENLSADDYAISSFFYVWGIVSLFNLLERIHRFKVLKVLGENSYVIYLIHMKVIMVMSSKGLEWSDINTILVLLLIVAFSYAVNRLINMIIFDKTEVT